MGNLWQDKQTHPGQLRVLALGDTRGVFADAKVSQVGKGDREEGDCHAAAVGMLLKLFLSSLVVILQYLD